MEDFGKMLKEARQRRGSSLAEMAELTKIKSECLGAMEEWRLTDLPSPAYTRGFIKIYCRYLELDPASFLEAYGREFEASQPKMDIFEQARPDKIPLLPRIKVKAALLVLGGLILAVLIFYGVIRLFSGGSSFSPSEDFQVVPDPYAPSTLAKIPLAADGADSSGLVLEIRGKSDSWVEVSSDGSLKYFNTLKAGRIYQAEAKKDFQVKLNSPGDVEMFLNGRPVWLEKTTDDPVTLKLDLSTVSGS